MTREQPMALGYAPPRYPRHFYEGEGEIVRVTVGEETVGYLTRQGGAFGWLSSADLSPEADAIDQWIGDTFRAGAASGDPFETTWALVLDSVQHDPPTTGHLDGFQD